MKKIEAVVRSAKFEAVKDALQQIGINFFTFTEVKGYGKQKGEHVVYRGAAYDVGYIARMKLEIIAPDERQESIVEAIRDSAHTGSIGDGKIIISPVETIIAIRSGMVNESAL